MTDTDPPLTPLEQKARDDAASMGMEIAERPESWGLPLVEGHQVSLAEWRAFSAFFQLRGSDADRFKVAARAAGVTVALVKQWQRRSWWERLFEEHVATEQQILHADLLSLRKDAINGFQKVLKGQELPRGSAQAIVAGVNLLTKVGKKPLQDSRNITTINSMNPVSVEVRVSKKDLDNMDQDEMLKVLNGEVQLPER